MSTRRTILRFPGVSFLPQPPAAGAGLPPLDTAAFVGFAARGPLDVPVALADINEYRAVFGGDLPLARDERGRTVYAHLPSAVAAFFANGGRHCYAVRVAGLRPLSARFALPGVLALGENGRPRLASAFAASPGRWAGALRMAARLMSAPLVAADFAVAGQKRLSWRADASDALKPGDVLRLTTADARRWLAPVASITAADGALTVELTDAWEQLSAAGASPPATLAAVRRLTLSGEEEDLEGAIIARPGPFAVELSGAGLSEVREGAGLTLTLSDGDELVFFVDTLRRLPPVGSPPLERAEVTARELLRLGGGGLPPALGGTAPARVERLRLDLLLRLDEDALPTLADLAFNAGHPRFWGEQILLESSPLYQRSTPAAGLPPETETEAARAARAFHLREGGFRPDGARDGAPDNVALAGLLAPLDVAAAALAYLPLSTPAVVAASDFVGQLSPGGDDLGVLEAGMFVDEGLAAAGRRGPRALLAEAQERYEVQGRRMYGLHSLMALPDAAILCVPDAAHRPWDIVAAAPSPALPPAPPPPEPSPCPQLDGPFEDCLRPPTLTAVAPAYGPTEGGTLVHLSGSGFAAPGPLVVRFGNQAAAAVADEGDGALRCLTPSTGAGGSVDVTVTTPGGSATLADAFTYQAKPTTPELPQQIPAASYDLLGAPLLPVQRALIDVCRALGERVCLLSLPAHFERRDCALWQQRLRRDLGLPALRGLDDGEQIADLSFAAVYHPWLLVRDEGAPDRMRATPCDGAVAGMIAAREHERGVWVAPANLPLQGVLGLTPALSDDDWAELFALQFNLVRREPRDFRPMSAHTLGNERALLQISVRRLLILLRKAAEERGMDFVFESNHERFREGVRALLQALLRGLYLRGAFAGATPEQSYRVLTDASVNPPESIAQGRFVASIEVAPAQPAEFITVLLTRGDQGQIRATEG